MLAAAADALEIPVHQASAAEAYLDARELRGRAGDDTALRFVLRPGHPDSRNGTETREIVLELKRIGSAGLAFTTTTTSGVPASRPSRRRSTPSTRHDRPACPAALTTAGEGVRRQRKPRPCGASRSCGAVAATPRHATVASDRIVAENAPAWGEGRWRFRSRSS